MNKYTKIAFGNYLIIAVTFAAIGFRYIFAKEILPAYYKVIDAHSWSSVVEGYKVMLLMFMKGAGLGYLTTAIAIVVLAIGMVKGNEKWPIWALPIVILTQLAGSIKNILNVGIEYQLLVPFELLVVECILFLCGYLFSLKIPVTPKLNIAKSADGKYPTISVISYILVGLMAIITACVYMISPQAMQYHMDALGVPGWSALEKGYQTLMLIYMRGAGLGFLVVSVAIAVMLVDLIQKPGKWMRNGLFVLAMIHTSVMIYIVLTVRFHSPGSPPIIPLSIALIFILVGYFIPIKKTDLLNAQ